MKTIMKRGCALLLALCLLCAVPARAATASNADRLHALGLFKGDGTSYHLDQTGTRIQGLVMLIRLLGEEDAALGSSSPNPFADVKDANYARYAAYAWEKGYTTGVTENTFRPDDTLNFQGYVTFLLRALGYTEGDVWSGAFTYAAQAGLMDSAAASVMAAGQPVFYRADMVDLSFAALTCQMKDGGGTLAQRLIAAGVFTQEEARAQGVLNGSFTYHYTPKDDSTISMTSKTYALPSGSVSADVVTVNTANPKVSVRAAMVNGTLGATEKFSSIVSRSGAAVVVNGNFFESYQRDKVPIGHVMTGGKFLYGVSGLDSIGFTPAGEVRVGKPAVFFYVRGDGVEWACYECNSREQGGDVSVLYTPARGGAVNITAEGIAVTVSGGVIQSAAPVAPGMSVPIPADGFVMHFGPGFTATDYYRAPAVGTAVQLCPELYYSDDDGFTLDGVTEIISGGPRLVKAGAVCTEMDASFQEPRFTTASAPRTAAGRLKDGKLVLASVKSATIQQMRELMLQLGCVDAVNLDGGASTALAYQGKVIRAPGRELTVTLQVFVEP